MLLMAQVSRSRLILICIGEQAAFRRLGLDDALELQIPAVSNAEILAMLQDRLKGQPRWAFAPAALKNLAQQVKKSPTYLQLAIDSVMSPLSVLQSCTITSLTHL